MRARSTRSSRRWIASPPALSAVVLAALAHYQFETLHPYSDGNGRLGRLLVVVQLLRGAVIREPLLVVSPWFERRRDRYQDELLRLSLGGDWDSWVSFFSAGVAASAADCQQKVERLPALREDLRTRVQRAGKRGAAEHLAADLVDRPYVHRSSVVARFGLSGQGAQNAVNTLVSLGILEESGIRAATGARLYVAREVVDIVSS